MQPETESGTCRYFYNSKNQQVRAERTDGRIQENRYDAEGLRHEMRENGKLLRFVYQNGELLYEEGGDKETAGCHLGAGIEAVRRGQRTYYYHPDEQLSTALITDETGTIKNQYRYDAFGAGLEVSEELPNRIRYTGQQYDEVTEQYYLRARYYNPILGRFLQEDVYQGDGLNLYAYCRNNPVVYYDPSGYNKIPDCVKTKNGETEDTVIGKDAHAELKEWREKSGEFDYVNQKLKDADGNVILVPHNISRKTGHAGEKMQGVIPDAIKGPEKGGIIYDDKPAGRPISKDFQEIGRNIEAYEKLYGEPPNEVIVVRYDKETLKIVEEKSYSPSDFDRSKTSKTQKKG